MGKNQEEVPTPITVEAEFLGEAAAFGLDMRIMGFGDFRKKTLGGIPAETVMMSEKTAWAFKYLLERGILFGAFRLTAKPDGRTFLKKKTQVIRADPGKVKHLRELKAQYEKALNDPKMKMDPEQIQVFREAFEAERVPDPYPGDPAPAPAPAQDVVKSEEVM